MAHFKAKYIFADFMLCFTCICAYVYSAYRIFSIYKTKI